MNIKKSARSLILKTRAKGIPLRLLCGLRVFALIKIQINAESQRPQRRAKWKNNRVGVRKTILTPTVSAVPEAHC